MATFDGGRTSGYKRNLHVMLILMHSDELLYFDSGGLINRA